MANMSPLHSASRFIAIIAAICGGLLTLFFHQSRGPVSGLIGVVFGAVSAFVAYGLVYGFSRGRIGNKKPVLGAIRGAMLGVATFLIAVIVHTALFPGKGGFFISLTPILLIGLGMFSWAVALVGGCVGVFCERRYFA